MNQHDIDRWMGSWTQRRPSSRRRLLAHGLAGGVFAQVLGLGSRGDATAVFAAAQDDCSLGCTSSVCGQVPPDCPLFPADNIWNTPVADLPLDPLSETYIASIGPDTGLHPDFGSGLYEGQPLGIPFVRVPATQPDVDVAFEIDDESDPGPYPIPPDAPIEGGSCGGGDRHVIVVQEETCQLYELYDATPQADGSWTAYAGAQFDLTSNALRPDEWTSADAAGLPILPGLVRYEEIAAGVIPHALRFTAAQTQQAYVWPARHHAGASSDSNLPPMGQRFRLKATTDISDFSPVNQVILQALKTYGMMLADNGSDWFLSGVPDDRWDNDDLRELRNRILGSDFEAVDCTSLMVDPNSGQALPA
ncbi:MAG: hypothetical protein M9947_01280 [Thermomicrobiales bacterium]|nr:hypothetical protein [Thermomicrobiales bacterium]